jgi:hypothetical protein
VICLYVCIQNTFLGNMTSASVANVAEKAIYQTTRRSSPENRNCNSIPPPFNFSESILICGCLFSTLSLYCETRLCWPPLVPFQAAQLIQAANLMKLYVISGFRRTADENCVLLVYYAATSGNSLRRSQDKLWDRQVVLRRLRMGPKFVLRRP